MTRFRLRCWQEQTLTDCCDYEVEADTLADAAALLDDLQDRAQAVTGPVSLPPNVRRIASTDRRMQVLDPDEVVDSVRGIAAIDDHGRKLRDVLPPAADSPADALTQVLTEFVHDIETVGVETVRRDWPDLVLTYEKARTALTPAGKRG